MAKIPSIKRSTKALLVKNSEYYRTLIITEKEQIKSQYPIEEILNSNCIYHGASLEGRRTTSSHYLSSNSKLPIVVNPLKGIYFFPTASTKNEDCVWLAYHHIKKLIRSDDKTYVLFNDGSGMFINASYHTVSNQKRRTSELIVQLNRELLFKMN